VLHKFTLVPCRFLFVGHACCKDPRFCVRPGPIIAGAAPKARPSEWSPVDMCTLCAGVIVVVVTTLSGNASICDWLRQLYLAPWQICQVSSLPSPPRPPVHTVEEALTHLLGDDQHGMILTVTHHLHSHRRLATALYKAMRTHSRQVADPPRGSAASNEDSGLHTQVHKSVCYAHVCVCVCV